MYAAPFYAESSFLMYRKDVLKKAGITMPERPTWDQVAAAARKVNSPDMAGICLRGKPGWGDLGASFTTVLNTFGGTWWSANSDGSVGEAMVDQPEFNEALQFYVDLVKDAGEKDAASASFNECLTQYKDGQVAMWYDATVAAGLLEADDSPVKGKNGYAAAPVKETDASGWLWSWALAIPVTSSKADVGWEYISFATGPQYLKQAGSRIPGGWAAIRLARASRPTRSRSTRRPPPRSPSPRSTRSRQRRSTTPARRTPGCAGRPVRRRPGVPGRRQPMHRAVLRGDRRAGVDRLGAPELPEHRISGGWMT